MEIMIAISLFVSLLAFFVIIDIHKAFKRNAFIIEQLTRHTVETKKHEALQQLYDAEARAIGSFIERFLGKYFNAQCNWFKPDLKGKNTAMFKLWVWKQYETRDMGLMIEAYTLTAMIEAFMEHYYSSPYFTDAMAFPKE